MTRKKRAFTLVELLIVVRAQRTPGEGPARRTLILSTARLSCSQLIRAQLLLH